MKLASIASNRLEVLLGRIVGVALLVNGVEPVINGLWQAQYFNSLGYGFLALFAMSSLVAGVGGWTRSAQRWFRVHALIVFFLMVLAPLGYNEPHSDVARPWVWWALGLAAVLFGISQKSNVRYWFILAMGITWFFVFGFGFDVVRPELAVLDSLYIIVFSIAIVSLTELVRQGATDVDEANSQAIESALEQAQIDAVERERARLDALMHDQVMHTLLLAARAGSKSEQLAAARSAESAIESLARVNSEVSGDVRATGLIRAIEKAAGKLDPRVQTTLASTDSSTIPADVAEAITEATLQAVDNAIQHSKAENIELKLRSKSGVLEFTIEDDGIGFRMDKVSRYRIGIRTSILGRMKSIGGEAKVESTPQGGTKVFLRWSDA